MKALKDADFPKRTRRAPKAEVDKGRSARPGDILIEAFALCREAARRAIGQRHFDVQLIGGMFLHQGCIAEMRTGEGKTLVATLPCLLERAVEAAASTSSPSTTTWPSATRSGWAARLPLPRPLGGHAVVHGLTDKQRQREYGADITYGQNNEFGFDYLRDNMKFRLEDYVQRDLNYAIVDEVDSILIDEARTPLIISGPTDESDRQVLQASTRSSPG